MTGLKSYQDKRKSSSPEPSGETKNKIGPGHNFVVQKHSATRLHFDFRLEVGGALKSWAIPKGPSLNPQDKRLAIMVEDHPLDYLKFEGTIPKGHYGAGEVLVWDIGTYEPIGELTIEAGLKKGHISFILYGQKLRGEFSLVRIDDEKNQWLFVKKDDEFSSTSDITTDNTSALSDKKLSGETPEENRDYILKKLPDAPMPEIIKPMMAVLIDKPFDRDDWIFEVKWDGYRAIAHTGKNLKLYSRNGLSFQTKYPEIYDALKIFSDTAIIDGEIVAINKNGKPDFQTLQDYDIEKAPLNYIVFDILYLNGKDLTSLPLIERKKILRRYLPEHPLLVYGDYVERDGIKYYEKITEQGLEGTMAKDGASPYLAGMRSPHWLKVKSIKEQEAIIAGYTEGKGSRTQFGSLVLAVYENGKLRHIGNAGSGFDEKNLDRIYKLLKPLEIKKSPLQEKAASNTPITWVEPKLIAQVKFSQWTSDGKMRHPIFLGLREDIPAQKVIKEEPQKTQTILSEQKMQNKVEFTNLEKVFWPDEGYTKGDLINYYDKIADTILPYLKDRPESLLRHPNGINGESFFHKNITTEIPPYVQTIKIESEHRGKPTNYLLCQNKETLLYMANLGCIEINPWNSRINTLEYPDYMIIDIDPGENTFAELIKVILKTHEILDKVCQKNYIKTSGKTGFHIHIPLDAKYEYEQIRLFAELISTMVHHELPDITSVERSPRKRTNKIYLDFLQNRKSQTLSSVYSLRPVPGATVSTPLKWEEVNTSLKLQNFNIKTIFNRLKKFGDLWQPVIGEGINLQESIECLQKELQK